MTNFKVISPPITKSPIVTPGGRTFAQTPGQAIDVVASDAEFLAANGWLSIGQSGTTAQRPTANPSAGAYVAQPGTVYVDTTLAAVIVWDGTTWRNVLTGAAA